MWTKGLTDEWTHFEYAQISLGPVGSTLIAIATVPNSLAYGHTPCSLLPLR